MHFTKKNAGEKRKAFLNNLKENKLLRFPGAYNPLCAKLIAEIGFDGVYISCLLYTSPSPRDRG